MTALPIEDPVWRDHFRARVLAERSVFRKLIQWGFTDSASDIYRMIEEKFNDAAEIRAECPEVCFRLTREDRIQLGDLLRERYLKIRDLPRRRASGELLQRGLLTRFQELSAELLQLYAQQFQQRAQKLTVEAA